MTLNRRDVLRYGASAALSSTVGATAMTAGPAAGSATPDLWRYATRPLAGLAGRRPLVIGAGRTRVITVTIRPSAAPGAVVRGTLYVDDVAESPQFTAGGTLAALPYAYRVG